MNSLSPRTWASYRSALRAYTEFCSQHSVHTLFPLSEFSLTHFATSLAQSSHSYGTIRVYISGLRFMQLAKGFPDPSLQTWTYLDQVLKGIRRSLPASVRSPRLPITPHILRVLFSVWSQPPVSTDKTMLWAACCVGFFWFLRSGEFTCSPSAALSGSALMSTDVAVDSHSHPTVVSVHLRHSKTDIFGAGTWVHMGHVDGHICPVKALLGYLAIRGMSPGPLFLFVDGSPLSRTRLVEAVRVALSSRGFAAHGFNGHSFRIGAATTAAACGVPDSLIQTLGRWRSSAFTTYIRTPVSTVAAVSPRLVAPHSRVYT